MRSVENAECRTEKRRKFQFLHFNFPFPCEKTVWKNNVNQLKKRNASLHFKMRMVRMVIGVGKICAIH